MMKIAVVGAYNPGRNTGMLTVDLAFHSIVEKYSQENRISATLLNVEDNQDFNDQKTGTKLISKKLNNIEELEEFDKIVYWGDFLHSRTYFKKDLRFRHGRRVGDDQIEEYLKFAYGLLMLEDADDQMLSNVICFGSSLIINTHFDDADKRYRASIKRLYENSRLVLLRDPLSAAFASRYANDMSASTLGVDCAFLLRPFDQFQWTRRSPAKRTPTKRVGFAFGRAISKIPELMEASRKFVDALAKQMGATEIVDIEWWKVDRRSPLNSVAEKLSLLASCDFVVTDIYHCSVNSWREGTPALCIGMGAEFPGGTLTEKKKEMLFGMFNLRRYYVFVENLMADASFARSVESSLRALKDTDTIESLWSGILDDAKSAERRLALALGMRPMLEDAREPEPVLEA
ncbi:polysaccharide pyruvyl transferase family protein [Humitalea sp. 24SJ18S-53]|uniref:polysaccharide pyruvyl transferase family protein n=1 Tax=Humitalea sp. 24SJ18S-53 TaxID=3422307 RepID=UPI003D66C969